MRLPAFLIVLPLLAVLTGCEALSTGGHTASRTGASSSVVEFLYPDRQIPPKPAATPPTVTLPIRVGLAFVPSKNTSAEPLSEAQKMALLEQVKARFASESYVTEIAIVPETYLRATRSGFDALDRAARMYGLDVMALVSYDQLSTSSEKTSSFWYWTIIGAYLVEGTRNDVQTLVDTAVFDIPSRTLLFRAAGTDRVTKDATMVESPQRLREAQAASFGRAMGDMTNNLERELATFKERVKEQKAPVRVADQRSGGGALGLGDLIIGLAALAAALRRRAPDGG